MFTGIVEQAEVVRRQGPRLVVRSSVLGGCAIGASVAVNGVCLTVTERSDDACTFDLAEETIARSTLGALRAGQRVNIERPLKAGDELGGHIVQGHVDGVGEVVSVAPEGNGARMRISVPEGLGRYIVEKGSVTVDGVALTVASVDEEGFEVALIPQTLAVTTLGSAEAGHGVNLEVDVLARYIEKLVPARHVGA